MVLNQHSWLTKYILNTSFHGFRYIAEPNRHWTERVFWVVCCSLSWWASGVLINSAWTLYQNNAISFVVDTSYSDWQTEFPSIYVCETTNEDKIAKFTSRLYGDPHDYNLDEIIKELVFYNGNLVYTLDICGLQVVEASFNCNLSDVIEDPDTTVKVRSTCKELFRTCRWNNLEYDCCKYFVTINTDLGMCYTINSQQTGIKDLPIYKMISNRTTGPGSLKLELNGENNVYMLGPLEVPSIKSPEIDYASMSPHIQLKRTITIKDIENQPEVLDLSIHQRKCRFAEENYLDVYPFYSYTACLMQCGKDAQLNKCGCAHHLMPNTPLEKRCNLSGLTCLQSHYREIMVQKSPASKKPGLVCDCLSTCTETHISTITENKFGFPGRYSIFELSLERLPTERYKRNVVNGKLALVVSIGSATALFLGASFLSFVEIIFYLVIQPLSDYISRKRDENHRDRLY